MRPFDILLLDEVTTALDVVVRQDLLMWLQQETVKRGATIVYATHIFDGLDEWPTHIHYLNYKGTTGWQVTSCFFPRASGTGCSWGWSELLGA